MLNMNDFEMTGEYRDVKIDEYFAGLDGKPILCLVSCKNHSRYILKPKEETMRTKEKILEDAGVSNANMLTALTLEVSIDTRDQLMTLIIALGSAIVALDNIELNLTLMRGKK